jgi:Caspase domain
MRRVGWMALVLIVGMLATTATVHAQKRVALVIGNGAYTKVPALPNPTNDAAAVEKLLRSAGFDFVGRADNLKLADLRKALRDFSAQVAGADIHALSGPGGDPENCAGGIDCLRGSSRHAL